MTKMTAAIEATKITKTTVGIKVVNIKWQGIKEKKNAPFHLSISCSS